MNARPQCLVIGYGNTLRRDDGVGVKIAEALAVMDLPGIDVITRHQLVPELAEPIARAAMVIFVDADVTAVGQPQLRPIAASSPEQSLAHAASPQSLLALAKDVFGARPRAWCLSVPVEDFNFGDGLSRSAAQAVHAAVQLILNAVGAGQKVTFRTIPKAA